MLYSVAGVALYCVYPYRCLISLVDLVVTEDVLRRCVTEDVLQKMCYRRCVTEDVLQKMCYRRCVTEDVLQKMCYTRCVTEDVLHKMCYRRCTTEDVLIRCFIMQKLFILIVTIMEYNDLCEIRKPIFTIK